MTFASKKLGITNIEAQYLIRILGKEKVEAAIYASDHNNLIDDPEAELKALKARFGTTIAHLHTENQTDEREISRRQRACKERIEEINRIRSLFLFHTPKPNLHRKRKS